MFLLQFFFFILSFPYLFGQPNFPSLREQAKIIDQWREDRIEHNLRSLMLEYGIDFWIVLQQEYAEDTVFRVMSPATKFNARRRQVTAFYLDAQKAIHEETYISYQDALFDDLRTLIEEVNPKNISIDIDDTFSFSDGLHAGMRDELMENLGDLIRPRLSLQYLLPIYYIDLRPKGQIDYYKTLMKAAWDIIAEGFSPAVITPGETTTDDVVWWFREKIVEQNYTTWFQPSVDIQRENTDDTSNIIKPGDMIHCDFGIIAMGMCTDTQHLGYVLKPGETDAPEDLKNGLKIGNQLQEIVLKNIRPGRSGNEILFDSLDEMKKAGINGTVYSHPIGDFGHSAGPMIGLWNNQNGLPKRGGVRAKPNTWFSVELAAFVPVASWGGRSVPFPLEEDMTLNEKAHPEWILSNQKKFHLI